MLHYEYLYINTYNYKYMRNLPTFDTAATYLVVVEGIKKGYIPNNYFTSKVTSR